MVFASEIELIFKAPSERVNALLPSEASTPVTESFGERGLSSRRALTGLSRHFYVVAPVRLGLFTKEQKTLFCVRTSC